MVKLPCSSDRDETYSLTNVGDIMQRVPCPGVPGKWLRLYLKSSDSNAIHERRAACSAAVAILYFANPASMGLRAWDAVAHSDATGALAHESEVGATVMICWTGSDVRTWRESGIAKVESIKVVVAVHARRSDESISKPHIVSQSVDNKD